MPGTEASNSPNTLVIAHLCALTGEPFDCHLTGGPCVGWAEAVKARRVSPLKPSATQLSIAAASKELMHHAERLALAEQDAAQSPLAGE
jgi:hypothetical protein